MASPGGRRRQHASARVWDSVGVLLASQGTSGAGNRQRTCGAGRGGGCVEFSAAEPELLWFSPPAHTHSEMSGLGTPASYCVLRGRPTEWLLERCRSGTTKERGVGTRPEANFAAWFSTGFSRVLGSWDLKSGERFLLLCFLRANFLGKWKKLQ